MSILYCDESGFTGQDLLNADQRYFSYGSVLIDPAEADEILAQAKTDFPLGKELKGSQMLSNSPGRKAAEFIFEKVADRSRVVVADKRFALAGKLYEYIFDPVVEGNSALYNVGFHLCLTNLLCSQFTSRNPSAVELLKSFQNAVRTQDFSGLVKTAKHGTKEKEAWKLAENLGKFCFEQQSLIGAEFTPSGNEVVDKWGLELSSTCLTGLLRYWAERGTEIHLVLDESKPLMAWAEATKDIFPVQPGPQEEGRYLEMRGGQHRVNFVLAEPIRFASSKVTPGLQLADVMAAFVSNLLVRRKRTVQRDLLVKARKAGAIDPGCMFPDESLIALKDPGAKKNLALLDEIFLASRRGEVVADVIFSLAQKVHRRFSRQRSRKR
jgi:hypothetical protein